MIGERSRRKRLSSAEPFLAEFELAQRPTKSLLTRHYDELYMVITRLRTMAPLRVLEPLAS